MRDGIVNLFYFSLDFELLLVLYAFSRVQNELLQLELGHRLLV